MRRLLIALAAISLLAAPCGAQTKTQFKTRSQLNKENAKLHARVDSLMKELSIAKEQLNHEDSLTNEIFGMLEHHDHEQKPVHVDYTPEMADSLLSEWYRQLATMEIDIEDEINMDSVRFTSNVPDSVLIKRLKAINCFFPLPYNETVRNYMVLYTEKAPKRLAKLLGLSQYYFPIFEEVLQKYELPQELEILVVIESAFNPTATSRVGAKGLWQFMPRTAKQYGLEINSFVDERMDTYKVCDAAARVLRDAYHIFGDWSLAISSYNCGPGNVNKAINRAGGKMDYWNVYEHLPRETRGYMPAFVGALYAFTYYKEYGIVPEQPTLPAMTDTIVVHKNVHFKQISDVIGVSEETLASLNAQYIHEIVPGASKPCSIILPVGYTSEFISHEDSIYAHKAAELVAPKVLESVAKSGSSSRASSSGRVTYKVKKGDTLGKIASKHHTSVKQIMRLNNLKSTNIRVGQTLVIRN